MKLEIKHIAPYLPYECVEYMFKNHYDVFGLIEQGLAVSIHDVEQHCL